jgi:hypothetical protein
MSTKQETLKSNRNEIDRLIDLAKFPTDEHENKIQELSSDLSWLSYDKTTKKFSTFYSNLGKTIQNTVILGVVDSLNAVHQGYLLNQIVHDDEGVPLLNQFGNSGGRHGKSINDYAMLGAFDLKTEKGSILVFPRQDLTFPIGITIGILHVSETDLYEKPTFSYYAPSRVLTNDEIQAHIDLFALLLHKHIVNDLGFNLKET